MKHIKPQKAFENLKTVNIDHLVELFRLSSSFFYNLSIFRNLYQGYEHLELTEDPILNSELQNLVQNILAASDLLSNEVDELQNELKM